MNFEEFKKVVIDAANALGLTEYELYYSSSESTSVEIFKHEINQFSSSVDGGVCFRCLVDGKMGYASTEELSEREAVSLVARAAENAKVLETDEQEFLGEGGRTYAAVDRKAFDLPTTQALIDAAFKVQEAAYAADPAVIDGTASEAVSSETSIAIVNSKGLDLSYTGKGTVVFSQAVVTDGAEMSDNYEVKTGDLNDFDLDAIAQKAVDGAKNKLGADVAPTGAYPVIFAPKAMSSLLSTYASVFSSEAARKGLSRLDGKEGEKIAADAVTLVDDPFYKDSAMPIAFDAEGTPAYRKNVIENGVLKTLLYNLKSAAAVGKKTTGNASKASYDAPVGIRPFTMYIAPGTLTEDELLKKAGNGVYIDFLGGLHAGANVISGDFSLQSAGFMIENGIKTKAVKSFTVAGNFYDLLNQITAVSDEVKMSGMGGFGGPTAFASPAVLVEGLSVAGK